MEKKSYRSLKSGPSTITSTSAFDSPESIFTVALLDSDPVLITKHPPTLLPNSALDNCLKHVGKCKHLEIKSSHRFRLQLRKLDQDNVNKFFGFSFDGLDYVVVWKMCPRGSLQAVIARSSMSTDSFFIQCLIRDVAEGLNYIHKSFLSSHAHLSSASCLVTESFQVKLCDYGLPELTRSSEITHKLWWAPELLNSSLNGGTKSADVYAFAIVASEIMARQPVWNLYGDNRNVEDLIKAIKHGGSSPLRPTIPQDVDISSEVLSLVRSCWRENAANRPSMDFVCEQLREILSSSSQKNLMDHVFSIMEEYTFTLEQEVGDRTKELTDEKKKADLLLSRMLPKEVAERLKLGQSVEPEGFDSVTVFFSDVVKFTALAAKCSPFQVVSLLNELYSSFDAIIEEHGAYKVESIGDGYLCVSGLPVRNGHQHVREIAQMSISFMAYVDGFRVVPFPRERIQLRIGLNSGPCVAGVVGLSMPRYCLFGDTVNTASRMESNGKREC
ncbi:unnamed protein product [Nippostrongylus brasiliensis]|uniref:Guanylate cyclase n=1 Tax=Nippostrongylus brasiliensis TaxID=27835 RepID=A0A0N4Y7F3_NIPBR|nr:unnamed protein product [Nippostrongylus brasiliensis]